MDQRIRLRYSGLTFFASKAFSIVTGFIFVIAVTRNVSSYDFGVWQNIGDMVGYFVILSSVVPGWVTRYVARNQDNAATTGLLTNLAISIPFIVAWILLAPQFAKIAGAPGLYYVLACLMILGTYLKPALEAIAQAKKPHLLGFDVVIHELTMISLGIILVMVLRYGLLGALVAVISSNFVDVLFYLVGLRGVIGRATNWGYLKSWLKSSTISVYGMIGEKLGATNMVLLLIYSGATARAYVGAAYAVALSISYVSTLAVALYPKLLAGGRGEDVETTLRLMFMFAIPMVAGTLVLAQPLLSILNPMYGVAAPVLYLLAISFLPYCLSIVLDTVLVGTERIDQTRFSMKDLVKSRLSLPASLYYLHSAITLPLLWIVLTNLDPGPLDAAFYLVAIGFVSLPISLTTKYVIARKYVTFKLPLKNLTKYSVASVIMAVVVLQLPVVPRISTILPIVAFGGAVYFTVLLIIDTETRALFRGVVTELKKTKGLASTEKRPIGL